MAKKQLLTQNRLLVILVVAFAAFLYLTLTGLSITVEGISGEEETMVGAEETYEIYLTGTSPESQRTSSSYVEQYGYWQLLKGDREVLLEGEQLMVENGIYNPVIAFEVPTDARILYLEAYLTEYTYTDINGLENYKRDDGELIASETKKVVIQTCEADIDCDAEITCQGMYGFCNAGGLCEVRGKCQGCFLESDCETGYVCSEEKLCELPIVEEESGSVSEQLKQVFSTSIVKPGETSREAPPILKQGVILAGLIVGYLVYKRRSRR